jgi:fatty-acyl-CoA synthase
MEMRFTASTLAAATLAIVGLAEGSPYLHRRYANHVPLSPLSFLERAADVHPDRLAVRYGTRSYDYAALHERSRRLAGALQRLGVRRGDVVAMLAANTPEILEAHFGVPLAGGILNTINTRLDADTIAYILAHGGARVFLTDTHLAAEVRTALRQLGRGDLVVVDITDDQAAGEEARLGDRSYDELLADAPLADWRLPDDEWDALSLNYTSGTSGRPKGVLYHHRGCYLMALGTIAGWGLPHGARYLYTVPLFHCNGWTHAWALAIVGGTATLIRQVSAPAVFEAIARDGITHMGGAPVVLAMLADAPEEVRRPLPGPVHFLTAGAPPPAAVLERVEKLGFDVLQVYGLTETTGHVVHCAFEDAWDALPDAERAALKARQGVRMPITEQLSVVDVETGQEVPADGETTGEVVIRGNTVMQGYLHDEAATEAAFAGGVFHSGDVAVRHPDGRIELRDRLKDVIISGGENVSSVEVENVLYRHPAVAVAAVVAQPDERWGEVPCAFVELRPGAAADEAEIIAFCRERLAGFKTPKTVVFGEVPRTSTGKIPKFELRQRLLAAGADARSS